MIFSSLCLWEEWVCGVEWGMCGEGWGVGWACEEGGALLVCIGIHSVCVYSRQLAPANKRTNS